MVCKVKIDFWYLGIQKKNTRPVSFGYVYFLSIQMKGFKQMSSYLNLKKKENTLCKSDDNSCFVFKSDQTSTVHCLH